MLEVWSVQRKMKLFVQEDLPDFETWVIEIIEELQSKKYNVGYVETEAFLFQTGSMVDGSGRWGKGSG